MFKSATLRLTGWYLLVLMALSITFSAVIYQITTSEVQTRLEKFQTSLQQSHDFDFAPPPIKAALLRNSEVNDATETISTELIFVNLFVLVVGGYVSYLLARRSLQPIEKAHEAQSRFTSDASHELRTPLAVMKTEMEVALMDKKASTTDLREVLISNLEEVDKLSKLAQMLLNMSQFDNNNLKLGPVNLYKASKSVIDDFKLPDSRITINSTLKPIIRGNETAVTELIKILVDNALQYSPKDSLIVINLLKDDTTATFEIINTGPGISGDKLPHIFDRFYRADSSRTSGPQKGYGLGLALAKQIVELHKGELIATSTPDHETIFSFILALNIKSQAKTQN
ncbi:MAG: HAMP domain-containing sensor histidine kinase [Candidatus Saccharibacteria bacterium]